jgi:hypothetical protein
VNIELPKAGLSEVYRGQVAPGLAIEMYRRAEAEAKKSIGNYFGELLTLFLGRRAAAAVCFSSSQCRMPLPT